MTARDIAVHAQVVGAMERLRSQRAQFNIDERGRDDMRAGYTNLAGEIRVNGAGESSLPITFPVKFTEKPLLTFGAEVIEGDAIRSGFMPWANVIVLSWITEEIPPVTRLYTGANLGVVSGGVPHQKMAIHWNLSGKAVADPI